MRIPLFEQKDINKNQLLNILQNLVPEHTAGRANCRSKVWICVGVPTTRVTEDDSFQLGDPHY